MSRLRLPPRVSRRAVRNQLRFMAGETVMEQPAPPRKTKPRAEREAGANDALKQWRQYRLDVRLWRNNVGAWPLPGGGWLRYGLCTGSADFVGLKTIEITPGMVGKRVAVFLAIESKAPGKDAEAHQQTWLDEVRDAGAIAGVARNAQEAEELLARWVERMVADER